MESWCSARFFSEITCPFTLSSDIWEGHGKLSMIFGYRWAGSGQIAWSSCGPCSQKRSGLSSNIDSWTAMAEGYHGTETQIIIYWMVGIFLGISGPSYGSCGGIILALIGIASTAWLPRSFLPVPWSFLNVQTHKHPSLEPFSKIWNS
jgi:hypothetical protein